MARRRGAGLTPFLAILRNLYAANEIDGNVLWFSNQRDRDVFLEEELRQMLGDRLRLLITQEGSTKYECRHLEQEYLRAHVKTFDQSFYVCGPDTVVKELCTALPTLGVDAGKIVAEDLDS